MDWNTARFDLENMVEETVPMSIVCYPERPGHCLLPQKRTLMDHVTMCHRLRGEASVVSDQALQDQLVQAASVSQACSIQGGE